MLDLSRDEVPQLGCVPSIVLGHHVHSYVNVIVMFPSPPEPSV